VHPLIKNQKQPAGNFLWTERPHNYVPFIPTRPDFYLPFPLIRKARAALIIGHPRTISASGPLRLATDTILERSQMTVESNKIEKSGGTEQPTP
jgi:hypothetical protein